MDKNIITVLVDNESWILPYAQKLVDLLSESSFEAYLVRDSADIKDGWINFILGCTKIITSETLKKNAHNLVVHESELPSGKGFAPMTWQIIEGKNEIPVCLLEASEEVDAGDIWMKDLISLQGHELNAEWRHLQGEKTIEMCMQFINNYPEMHASSQHGNSSWYPRRKPSDSILNINRTIAEQFNLLRTVDNELYPAYFEMAGYTYQLKIEKIEPTK